MGKSDRDAILKRRAKFIATALASAGVTVATAEGCAKKNDVPARTAQPTATVEVPDLDAGASAKEPDAEPMVQEVETDAEPPELPPQVCLEPPEQPRPAPKPRGPSICLWID